MLFDSFLSCNYPQRKALGFLEVVLVCVQLRSMSKLTRFLACLILLCFGLLQYKQLMTAYLFVLLTSDIQLLFFLQVGVFLRRTQDCNFAYKLLFVLLSLLKKQRIGL